VNTNLTLPTMSVMPDDHNGHRQWLTLDWVNGANRAQSLAVKLDWDAHEGGQDGLMANFDGLFQHIWLMGYEAGVNDDRQAREDGYSHGAHPDFPNPFPEHDDRRYTFNDGMAARRDDNDAGQRIEGLIGQAAQLGRDLHTRTSERDEAIERVNQLMNDVSDLQDSLAQVTEQRDAMAESLNSIQRDLITAEVPSVEVFEHGTVTVYRAASNFNVQQWVPDGGTRWESGVLAAELRGAFADAFHAGRNEREGEMRAEMEREAERVRGFDQNIANQARIIQELNATIADYQHDWDVVRDHLLEEAENRNWCSEYDDYARNVNELTRRFDLIVRQKTYNVTVTVSQDVDYSRVDNAASEAGFPISYDVGNSTAEEVRYEFTLEDVPEGQIAAKAEQLRRAIYAVSGINSAEVSWEEAD